MSSSSRGTERVIRNPLPSPDAPLPVAGLRYSAFNLLGLLVAGGCIVGRPDPGGGGGGRLDGGSGRCTATAKDVCEVPTRYCAGTRCAPCAPGTFNCDGVGACESLATCEGAPCDLLFACTQPGQFCNPSTASCQRCVAGWLNCDGRDDNACERSGLTCVLGPADSGLPPPPPPRDMGALGRPCEPSQVDACGAVDVYCSPSFRECRACPTGTFNCNRASAEGNDDGCESGAACCDPEVRRSCSGTQSYCVTATRACTPCPEFWYNCDGLRACESTRICF